MGFVLPSLFGNYACCERSVIKFKLYCIFTSIFIIPCSIFVILGLILIIQLNANLLASPLIHANWFAMHIHTNGWALLIGDGNRTFAHIYL